MDKVTEQDENGYKTRIAGDYWRNSSMLYKFRSWIDDGFSKRILTDNEVFFSSASRFNDPYDTTIPFRYNPKELTPPNILRKLIQVGHLNYPHLSETEVFALAIEKQASRDYSKVDNLCAVDTDIRNSVYNTFGALSLTTDRRNELMWSHYSNSHRGICIGLDNVALFNASRGIIGPVMYSDEVPIMSLFGPQDEFLLRLFYTKKTRWAYEKEIRLIYPKADTAVKISTSAVKEIIMGCKISDIDKLEIIELKNTIFPHCKLFQSIFNYSNHCIDIIEI